MHCWLSHSQIRLCLTLCRSRSLPGLQSKIRHIETLDLQITFKVIESSRSEEWLRPMCRSLSWMISNSLEVSGNAMRTELSWVLCERVLADDVCEASDQSACRLFDPSGIDQRFWFLCRLPAVLRGLIVAGPKLSAGAVCEPITRRLIGELSVSSCTGV